MFVCLFVCLFVRLFVNLLQLGALYLLGQIVMFSYVEFTPLVRVILVISTDNSSQRCVNNFVQLAVTFIKLSFLPLFQVTLI